MLVHHHVKYKEIHGYDEVVLMEESEHRRLHNRLRREGKCNIPAPVLAQVSNRANHRRDEYREWMREWQREYEAKRRQDPAYRERMREYNTKRRQDPAYREWMREYSAKWYTKNGERAREHQAKRRTVFARLRPDIVNAALVRPCAASL